MNITDSQLTAACDYIRQQFDAHSWWPKAQPEQAKHEFELMHANAVSLTIWCEKWLDKGQYRQL